MRNLMKFGKFGIVLVVVAMVTSIAFADNTYEGDDPGSWCDEDNWSEGDVPECGDGEKVEIENGEYVIIDCEEASCDELEMEDGSLQVGTTIANGDPADVHVDFTICKDERSGDLEMSESSSSNFSLLKIVNGDVTVEGESKDVGKKGNAAISIAAGSSLTFEDGVRIGTSNSDGCDNVHTLDIAGDFTNNGNRFRMEGGTLTINLTGNGTFYTDETTRLSRYKDAMTIVNISDNAAFLHDKDIEMGSDEKGTDCGASLVINISDNGTWDGSNKGKDLEFKKDGQILNVTIIDNGSLIVKNCGEHDDAELNLIVDGAGASFTVTEDLDVGQGTILITGNGGFEVGRRFDLGIDGDAYMLVATTGDVRINERLRIGKEGNTAKLTIDGCRVDIDDNKDGEMLEMGENSSIDILGDGQLVIKDADDQEDWDELNAMIDDGLIMTSEEGMVVVSDYGVTHGGKFTMQLAIAVDVDILPGGCPNPLRVNFIGKGVYTVAIVGSENFDVLTIDVDTITLIGVAPIRSIVGDVSTAGDVCELGPDQIPDLVLKFDRQAILDALEESVGDLSLVPHREQLPLTLLAKTDEGTLVTGTDYLTILNRGAIKRKK